MPFRIWRNNPLSSRRDLFFAFDELFEPLLPTFLEGGARVRISETGSACLEAAAEFEGYLRPLWGIVPYQFGGGDFKYWELYRRGLVNGTDPQSDEYWGDPKDYDQLLVDLAAIGYALCFLPQHMWEPLLDTDKSKVADYLVRARAKSYCFNNWMFFRVILDLGLTNVGVKYDEEGTMTYLDSLDSLYLADGWYGDGKPHRIDNYNALAFHFYSLIYVLLMKEKEPERCKLYVDRATLFAQQYIHWFDDTGSVLPFGRSLIYRFATAGFWGLFPLVLDCSEKPPISWSVMKTVFLKNLQWWSTQPLNEYGSGFLSLGYSYPNFYMMERYNSPQSPYWAFKAFSGLMIPDEHPFWQAEFTDLTKYYAPLKLKRLGVTGIVIDHQPENTIALINGPWNDEYQAEKYSKFAYSTRFGFGVISNSRTFEKAHLDNSLGFSFNKEEFFVRQKYKAYEVSDYLLSTWEPTKDIKVESWTIPKDGYHLRLHFVDNQTSQLVYTREGGFAIPISKKKVSNQIQMNVAMVSTDTDHSEVIGLEGKRDVDICDPEPNTNVLFSKVKLPVLCGTIQPKSRVRYACLAFAQSGKFKKPDFDLTAPLTKELEELRYTANRVVCNRSKW
ncbi:CIC11C00000004585 [Sungouiella intermedia]|uniref:CIC11C00000004585 n=1 Tax=Sungouiella intermedia TaxID=45354 RepID=A0A1L0CVK4_9ASCO|nr:CIC11C00000004585 [[Candida] intermedia]